MFYVFWRRTSLRTIPQCRNWSVYSIINCLFRFDITDFLLISYFSAHHCSAQVSDAVAEAEGNIWEAAHLRFNEPRGSVAYNEIGRLLHLRTLFRYTCEAPIPYYVFAMFDVQTVHHITLSSIASWNLAIGSHPYRACQGQGQNSLSTNGMRRSQL